MIIIPHTKKLLNIYKLLSGRVDEQTLGGLKQLKSILSLEKDLGQANWAC